MKTELEKNTLFKYLFTLFYIFLYSNFLKNESHQLH